MIERRLGGKSDGAGRLEGGGSCCRPLRIPTALPFSRRDSSVLLTGLVGLAADEAAAAEVAL